MFTTNTYTLGELLSGSSVLVVPAFQRAYCWTSKEVERLLEDLLRALTDGEDRVGRQPTFFLGTIVLVRRRDQTAADSAVLEIIDGQQRLVTLTVLYAVLRDLLRADGDARRAVRLSERIQVSVPGRLRSSHRIEVRAREQELLERIVLQPGACLETVDASGLEGAERQIADNRQQIADELRQLDVPQRARLADFLDERCLVVSIVTDEVDNAFRIFTVVNLPGKPLSRGDIVKAELMSAVPATLRPAYLDRWSEVEDLLRTEVDLLLSHVRTALGNGRRPVIAETLKLAADEGGAAAFIDRVLAPLAARFALMIGRPGATEGLSLRAQALIQNLSQLSHSDWMPATLFWLHTRIRDPRATEEFLATLERAAYGHLLLGLGREKRLARYSALLAALRADPMHPARASAIELSTDDQRNILYNATNNVYDRNAQGCKLLLLRLNDALAGRPTGVEPSEVTVEHVLPQRLPKTSPWRQLFPDAMREYATGSLGNLILVSQRINKDAANLDFARKLEHYRRDNRLADLPLNQGVMQLQSFGPRELVARERALVETMRSMWQITVPYNREPPAH